MNPKTQIFYNAIALMHINKKGGEMLADFESVLKNAGESNTVSDLLNLSGEQFLLTNANETMGTGQVGYGAEFIEDTILSGELIDRLKESNSLLSKAVFKQMNTNSQDFPVRGAKIRMSLITEPTGTPNATDPVAPQVKKAKTAEINMTAKEMVITVYYSDTLLEDSVIAIAEYVMQEIVTAYESSLHQIILNGDTATGTGNINIDGANTSTLTDGNLTDYILADGARKTAITNSATVDAGGSLGVDHIRSARAKMGKKGLNPADLVMVPDQTTYYELMNLGEVETIEKFGDAATIKNGVLVAIDGIEIVNREEMPLLTDTAGKVSSTGGNNLYGSIVIIHAPSLYIGFRRGLRTEVSRYAETRTTGVTGSARLAVKFNDIQNEVTATSSCALIIKV